MKTSSLFPSAAALAVLLCLPASGFAQTILNTAANFTLLGGTAITSTGTTGTRIITGNVGLSPGATSGITGFPPAVLSGGGAIVATGAVTSQARLDLITASVALAGMPSNVNMSNVNLGGTTLAPGVYTFNGTADLSGALVLDAQGQNNVAWVFQIGTSLTTAINSSVTFVNLGSNGGSDLGLFWNAGSAITIGGNNQIAGNYIAGTSITFGGLTSGGARALSLAGISLDNNVIDSHGGPGGGDFTGGLMFNASGDAVPTGATGAGGIVVPGGLVTPGGVVMSGGTVVPGSSSGSSGSVLLGATGAYTTGSSNFVLTPGAPVYTTLLTVDGGMANGSAPASLHVAAATVTLSGTNTYTGGTYVDAGALVTGSDNLPANQAVSLSNGGVLVFSQATNGTFGGAISGSGSLAKLGTGALTVVGNNTYSGGTLVSGGTLIGSTTSLPASGNVTVASGATLVFNQATDGVFGGNLAGSGTVQKTGAGALTLTKSTATTFALQAGALYFNDGLGTTTVEQGAFLGGNGTITGNLTNSGTVSPGYSPGTITVTGNYTQTATGTLIIELASGTSFDQLVINGSATLAGTLQIDVLNGYDPAGQTFTFLTAADGVTGTFGTVNGTAILANDPTRVAVVNYGANNVSVAIVQTAFSNFALTPNQAAVATAAQASPALRAKIVAINDVNDLPVAFNALSPQGYQIWSDVAFTQATALSDRLKRNDGAMVGHDNYYFDVSQRRDRASGNLDVGSTTFTTTSGLVGMDHVVDRTLTAGGFFNHSETVASLGRPGSRTQVKSKMLGVRAAWEYDQWFANASYAYGWDRYRSTRPVVFAGVNETATSSTRGRRWFTDLSAGRHFTHGSLSLSPFAGVLVSGWRAKGFTESGAGVYHQQLADQSARSLRTQVGLEGQFNWTFGSLQVQPHARVAWLSEFSNDARSMHAVLDSVSHTVVTRGPQRDSMLVNAGVNVLLNPRTMLYADITTQSGGVIKHLSDWRIGASIRF